jgi:hypothetical protein
MASPVSLLAAAPAAPSALSFLGLPDGLGEPILPAAERALGNLPQAADLAGNSNFWDGAMDRLKDVATSPMGIVMGLGWTLALGLNLARVFRPAEQAEPVKPGEPINDRMLAVRKRAFINGLSLGGSVINTVGWLHTVKLIPMEQIAAVVLKGCGYGISLLVSGAGFIDEAFALRESEVELAEALKTKNKTDINIAQHKRSSAIINMAGHAAMVAWSILGIIVLALSLTMPFLSLILGLVLLTAISLTIAGAIYKIYISGLERQREEAKAGKAAPAPVPVAHRNPLLAAPRAAVRA